MITVLSKEVINKIAAGEVVERPASVVKELMENAFDAGATKITVTVSLGGLKMVSVEDDGIGIEKKDLPKLFTEHATSKIVSIDDLHTIKTFGFRGEALASIASVSKVELLTRASGDTEASKVRFLDGVCTILPASAAAGGTIITVHDLFYNIPARRKFLKTEKTEFSNIIKVFQQMAMIHHDVELVLVHNQKEYIRYEREEVSARIKHVCHAHISDITSIYASEDLVIEAALPFPGTMESVSYQYVYVNNRSILAPYLAKAVKEAYKSYLVTGSQPSFVLMIAISPNLVDVNVHPRKSEVRFLNQYNVYSAVYKGCLHFCEKYTAPVSLTQDHEQYIMHDSGTGTEYKNAYTGGRMGSSSPIRASQSVPQSLEFTQQLFSEIPVQIPASFSGIRDCIQIGKKFIVFAMDEKLYIIDQHAAHERINYEKLMAAYVNRAHAWQIPVIPFLLRLAPEEYEVAVNFHELIAQYGIAVADAGNNSIHIVRFTDIIPASQVEKIFLELLQNIRNETLTKIKGETHEKTIASIACRSAIMFGKQLSSMEMQSLIQDLLLCKSPWTCAHGRPIAYILPFGEIMKQVARC